MKKSRKHRHGAAGRKRANGTGTIERYGDHWRARWSVTAADGTTKRQSKTLAATSLEEARRELAELTGNGVISREREIRRHLDALDGVAAERRNWENSLPALAIEDAFAAYLKSGMRPDSGARTLSDYEGYVEGLAKWLAAHRPNIRELREISQGDAEAYAADLRATRSANTFNKRVVFFRCLWRTLTDADAGKNPQAELPSDRPARLSCNPWEKIRKLEATPHTRREFTVEELGRIIGASDGELRLLFAIGLYTGLRLGDSALLEWGAVDLARGRISVIPRKTARHAHGKPVVIPIHATLLAMLCEIPPQERMGYVLPETAAAYMKEPSIVTNRIQRHFESCGIVTKQAQGAGRKAITLVGFHSLRHTFVSLSANAGASLALVQSIVGHSNPAMTRHYYHESENALKSTVATLPDITTAASPHQNAPGERGAETGATMPQPQSDALRAFYAAFDALTPEEREAALAWANAQPLF